LAWLLQRQPENMLNKNFCRIQFNGRELMKMDGKKSKKLRYIKKIIQEIKRKKYSCPICHQIFWGQSDWVNCSCGWSNIPKMEDNAPFVEENGTKLAHKKD